MAEPTQQLEAAPVGEHQIEDDQIERTRISQPLFGSLDARGDFGLETISGESIGDGFRDGGFVFDDQDARRHLPTLAQILGRGGEGNRLPSAAG